MGKYLTPLCAVLVILSQLAAPFAIAQENVDVSNAPRANVVSYPTGTGGQYDAYRRGAGNADGSGSAEDLAASALGCSVGQILGSMIADGLSSVVNELTSSFTSGETTSTTGGTTGTTNNSVPVNTVSINEQVKSIDKDTTKQTNKEVDGWDAIGFCIANASIQYLTQSTINWINSGFEGNPTFVDDPEKFFQDIAEYELGSFVQELGLGFMCSPGAQSKVKIAIVNDYLQKNNGKAFADRYKCSFDQIGTNVEAFLDNFKNGGVNAFVEFMYNPAARQTSAYLAAQDELAKRTMKNQGKSQWELRASDYLHFKKCDTVRNPGTNTQDQGKCKTYTPGQMIEEQANAAINSPRNRLEIADEFDEVVSALIDQLIRVALSEITSVGEDDDDDDEDEEEIEVNNEATITIPQTGANNNNYRPVPTSEVTGICEVSTTTVAVDEPVDLRVSARGGNGSYLYDWLGSSNFPTSTRASRLTITFSTTTEASDISVRARSGGKVGEFKCPNIRVTPPVPLKVSCEPTKTKVSRGESVTWESIVSGGTGYYTYEWKGDINSLSKTSQDNTVTYSSKGTYDVSLVVTSGSQSEEVECEEAVKVR